MITIAVFIFLVLLLFDLPGLIRARDRRTLIVYCALSCLALSYMICYALDVQTFSAVRSLSLFFQDTLGLNYALWQGHS